MSEQNTLEDFAESEDNEQGWGAVQLGNEAYFTRYSGDTPSRSNDEYWGGDIPWLSNSEVHDGTVNFVNETEDRITKSGLENCTAQLVPAGSVILSCTASIGKVAINNRKMVTNQQFNSFNIKRGFNSLYLANQLLSMKEELETLGGSTTHNHLSVYLLDKVEVEKPPLLEQRKIATVLHTVDQAIQKTEEIIKQSKRVKLGVKQDLLSEGYYKHDTEQRRIGAKLKEVPSEWEIAEIGELAEYQNGYGFSKEQWSDTGRPIIRIQDLTTPEESDTNYFEGEIDSKYEVENGDILVSWSATLGVYRWSRGDAVLNQHIFKVRNIEDNVSERFLYHILEDCLSELERKLHGSTMKHVTRSAFEGTEVPFPPKDEQVQIAQVLDDIDQQIQSQKGYLNRLRKIKQGLMQDLLSGTVRTTDTNIEVPDEITQYG